MIFCPAAKEKKKRKNITKSLVFAFENFYSLSLCAYSLNRSPYPRGTHTHTHTPNFRSFCALPFAAFRRIDFAGVCLSGVCSFLSAESEWIRNPYLFFLLFVCARIFCLKGGIKNSPFMPHFLTHILNIRKNKNGSDDSTKNPRRVQRLVRYDFCSLCSSFGFELVVARGGPFFITSFFPESKFCHHRLTELLFPINSLSLSNGVIIYNTTTGVTLYHNWVKYYGPKGIAPYFLKTEGAVAMVCLFVFFSVN